METERITVTPGLMGGRPCIRGMRITVDQVLFYLAHGQSIDQILEDFPYLEREDVIAAEEYAAMTSGGRQPVRQVC